MSQTLVIFSPESYSVSMTYDNMGGIVQKNQTASLNYPGYPGEKYNYYYTQGNTAHPHATSKVWDRRNHKQYTYGFDSNGNPTTTHEQYAPPLQGQPNPSGPIDLIQQNYWDEKNQLRGLWNLSGLHHYIYDADGQRLMKSSVPMSYSSVNAQQLQATNSIAAEDYTVYVSAGLVYESNRGSTTYTKHYYAGPLRVASQIGSANPNYETHPIGGQIAPGGPSNTTPESYGVAILSDLNTLLANYGMAVNANEPPQDTLSMQVISNPDECKIYYGDDVIEENRCLCDNFPDIAIQQGINCNPYTPIYWYHPDYIGNIEFVTDRTGQPYQHFYYAAFGDPLVSQHVGTGSFNSAFRFNAKEYDEETGNYYYGARYYEPKSSVWMGVDALATSYPSMNPYNFVLGNPIMAMDPDGNEGFPWYYHMLNQKAQDLNSTVAVYWSVSGGLGATGSYSQTFAVDQTGAVTISTSKGGIASGNNGHSFWLGGKAQLSGGIAIFPSQLSEVTLGESIEFGFDLGTTGIGAGAGVIMDKRENVIGFNAEVTAGPGVGYGLEKKQSVGVQMSALGFETVYDAYKNGFNTALSESQYWNSEIDIDLGFWDVDPSSSHVEMVGVGENKYEARVNIRVNFKPTGANPTDTYIAIKTNVFFEKINGNYVEITE